MSVGKTRISVEDFRNIRERLTRLESDVEDMEEIVKLPPPLDRLENMMLMLGDMEKERDDMKALMNTPEANHVITDKLDALKRTIRICKATIGINFRMVSPETSK